MDIKINLAANPGKIPGGFMPITSDSTRCDSSSNIGLKSANDKKKIIIQRMSRKEINVNGMQLKKIRIPLK